MDNNARTNEAPDTPLGSDRPLKQRGQTTSQYQVRMGLVPPLPAQAWKSTMHSLKAQPC